MKSSVRYGRNCTSARRRREEKVLGNRGNLHTSMGVTQVPLTCKANLFVTKQAEDAVVELHVPAVVLIHLSQHPHQLCPSLGGMAALQLMRW